MKLLKAAITLAIATTPCAAGQQSVYERANLGDGTKTCEEWLKDRSVPAARAEESSWVLGYLSARAAETPNLGKHIVVQNVAAAIDSICAANRGFDLRQATRILAIKLDLEPMPQ